MNRRRVVFLVAIVIAGVLGFSGNVWAQAVFIPMSGFEVLTTADSGVMWTDEEGITHIRGLIRTGISTGQDADGNPIATETVYHSNININMATGDGDYLGRAYVGGTYRGLIGSFQGQIQGTFTAGVLNGTFNYPRGEGDWDGFKLRGSFVSVWGSDVSDWEGIIHMPNGELGDKAALYELRTLGEVKALYR